MQDGTIAGSRPRTRGKVSPPEKHGACYRLDCPDCDFRRYYTYHSQAITHQKRHGCPNCDRMVAVRRIEVPITQPLNQRVATDDGVIVATAPATDRIGTFSPHADLPKKELDWFFLALDRAGYFVDEQESEHSPTGSSYVIRGGDSPPR